LRRGTRIHETGTPHDESIRIVTPLRSPAIAARPQRGFTLLEVTIVGAIIAILTIVALPSYDSQRRKAVRASAESHLMDIASRQQQYLFDSRAYAADLTALNMTTPSDVATNYTITVAALAGPPPTFTVTATPKGTQVKDLGGAALTINNAGAKTPAGAW
jgi:type IV pilus assembly protein PilE